MTIREKKIREGIGLTKAANPTVGMKVHAAIRVSPGSSACTANVYKEDSIEDVWTVTAIHSGESYFKVKRDSDGYGYGDWVRMAHFVPEVKLSRVEQAAFYEVEGKRLKVLAETMISRAERLKKYKSEKEELKGIVDELIETGGSPSKIAKVMCGCEFVVADIVA